MNEFKGKKQESTNHESELEKTLNESPQKQITQFIKTNPDSDIPSYLVKELLNYTSKLEITNKELANNEGKDELTGLITNGFVYNQFKEKLLNGYKTLKTNSNINEINYAFIMLDADDFTNGNTIKGHYFMDGVLKDIAEILKDHTRKDDLVARLGGEEFSIICDLPSEENVLKKAKQIKNAIANYKFNDGYKQTVSVGADVYKLTDNDVKVLDKIFKEYDMRFKNCIENQRSNIVVAKNLAIDKYLKPIYENLRENSDNVTYQSKNSGKNNAFLYDPNMDYETHRVEYSIKKKGVHIQENKITPIQKLG